MTRKYTLNTDLLLALIPGANHMRNLKIKRGISLLVLALLLGLILFFNHSKIIECLNSKAISSWSAALVYILLCVGTWVYSIVYAIKIQSKTNMDLRRNSSFHYTLKRFSANSLANISAYLIVLMFIVAFLAPILAPYDPHLIKDVVNTRYQAPSFTHLFGTDSLGRDLFSRALFGARISLSIGILSVLISMSLGTIYGAVAGYFGGVIDNVLMRFVDVIMAFPIFFLMLLLVGVFDASILMLILILGFTSWAGTARYIRGEILSLRERAFIESSQAIGLPAHTIIWRHLIPNALSPVLVTATLMVGGMITAEAGLSFLGIGIRPPTPSWGNMISEGQDAVFTGWWIAFFPGLLLTITILSFNLLADGLRDALDTKTLMRKYV
jgi:peptide/nickel transport system permease protein